MRTHRPHPRRLARPHPRRGYRPHLEGLEGRQLLATFIVTNTADSGPGTLRQAILDSNANPGPDAIGFAIPNQVIPGMIDFDRTYQIWRIHVETPLPTITDLVSIDGYSQRILTDQQGANEVQTISLIGQPFAGTFTLTFEGQTTAPIPYNATADLVGAALEALPNIGPGNVAVSLGPVDLGLVRVEFQRALGQTPVGQITGDASGLITPPGLTPAVFASTLVQGVSGSILSEQNELPVGFNASVRVIVDGSDPITGDRADFPGLTIETDHARIRGLSIDGFSTGIVIQGPSAIGNLIQGNYIGRYVVFPSPVVNAGTSAVFGIGNGVGVLIASPTNNSVGGVAPETHNAIAGNEFQGVHIAPGAHGNQVVGNLIGLLQQDADFYYQVGNGLEGVLVESSSNAIGGNATGATNVISANGTYGIRIAGPDATRNRVQANYIGTDISGGFKFGQGNPGNGQDDQVPGNLRDGVFLDNAPYNQVGIPGGTQGVGNVAGNVIAGNFGAGVRIAGPQATGNIIQGNVIGAEITGQSALPNFQEGVVVFSAGNFVGGDAEGAGNLISGNRRGVYLSGEDATGNTIAGNFIGTDGGGAYDLGNALEGVRIDGGARDNTVGGTTELARNLISGNNSGVAISDVSTTANLVAGNFIGTDITGMLDLNNSQEGVLIDNAPANTIGGASTAAGNLISANHWGVVITGATASDNRVQGNKIGTDVSGTHPLGNELDGVLISQGASSNLIGGSGATAGNTIAFNVRDGVRIEDTSVGNAILTNSIFRNGALGINLVAPSDPSSGVTPNDPGDVDSGPNNLQNAPTLTAIATSSTSTTIQGTLSSNPNRTYTIQFFANVTPDPSGFGEGQTFIGQALVTTNSVGLATFSAVVPVVVPGGQFVTATATDPSGDTSEFSNAVSELLGTVQFSTATYTVVESAGVATITVTRAGGSGGYFTVPYSTADGTALAGVDYLPASGTLTFEPGVDTQTFLVTILNDVTNEPDKTVLLNLGTPTGAATLGTPSTAVLTIEDDDQPGVLRFSTTSYVVQEDAGAATITVERDSGGGLVTVAFATANGTAVAGVDYVAASGVLTFQPGQTVAAFQVPILFNIGSDSDKTVLLSLSDPTGGAALGTPASAVLTIANVTAPVVTGITPIPGRRGTSTFVVGFSADLDPARAVNLLNYGYSVQAAGRDRRIGTRDDVLIGLTSAVYDPATRSVTLTTAQAIHPNLKVLITINQRTDVPSAGVGVATPSGTLLDGNGDGRPGGVFSAVVNSGRRSRAGAVRRASLPRGPRFGRC
jgi:hypothetical protein